MPPRKRRRVYIAPPSPDQTTTPQLLPKEGNESPPEEGNEPAAAALPTIPDDLLPEIAARSDVTTLVRCAACCKALRRDILSPAFIRRVCREPGSVSVPPRVLGFLHAYDKARQEQPPARCFSAAHPATPGVASFFEEHLAPFVARTAERLLGDYEPLTSRNGLVVLRRRYRGGGDRSSDICVYDPMSGDRTFLPSPPDIRVRERKASEYGVSYTYVLLTAADGIVNSSFLVLAADFTGLKAYSANIKVQTVAADNEGDGTYAWSPVAMVTHPRSRWFSLQPHCSAVVLRGSIHWLMYNDDADLLIHHFLQGQPVFHILTYDVRTATAGLIELPEAGLPHKCKVSNLHLGSSPDGRLSLHIANRLKISVWLLGPDGEGWSQHAMVDIKMAVKSLIPPDMPPSWWAKDVPDFASSGARSGAILLRPLDDSWSLDKAEEESLAVLDMETKELRRVIKKKHITVFPYEIDLETRLSTMRTF